MDIFLKQLLTDPSRHRRIWSIDVTTSWLIDQWNNQPNLGDFFKAHGFWPLTSEILVRSLYHCWRPKYLPNIRGSDWTGGNETPCVKHFKIILYDGLDTKRSQMWTQYWFYKFYLTFELLNGLKRVHWYCTTQRQGNTMIHKFWDLNFSCDHLSLKRLFYNRVTYQIINIVNTHKQWFSMEIKKHELTLRPHTVQLCSLSVLSTVSALPPQCYSVRDTHWCFEINSFWEILDLMSLHWFFEPQSSKATKQTKPSTAFLIFIQSINLCQLSLAHFCVWKLKLLSKSTLIKCLLK